MSDNFNELLSKFTFKHSVAPTPGEIESDSEQTRGSDRENVIVKRFKEFKKESVEESILAKDLSIKGAVTTTTNIRVEGNIEGDLSSQGDIIITGTVTGNVKCTSITMEHSVVTGNIESANTVILYKNSVVTGDILAQKMDIAGEINGNISAEDGGVICRKSAVIMGDIKAGAISIAEGATINGKMKITNYTKEQQSQPLEQ